MSTIAHISLAQYELMAEHGIFSGRHYQRVELVRGEIRQMNPIGIDHAMAVNYLAEWSFRILPERQFWVGVQNPIHIPKLDSAPQPDLTWLERKEYANHPLPTEVLLLIEVADTTLDDDRGEKAELYAEAGIADYWVVDCRGASIAVMRQPVDRQYREVHLYRGDDAVRPLCFPSVALRPAELFRR